MRRIHLMLLILLPSTVLAQICGPQTRIYNGTSCSVYNSKVVFIFSSSTYCSGTLIAPDTVLTAAHCRGAAHEVRLGSEVSRVAKFIRHRRKGWVQTNRDYYPIYDIAIIKLKTPFKTTPARIDFRHKVEKGQFIYSAGYGLDETGADAWNRPWYSKLEYAVGEVSLKLRGIPVFEIPYASTNSGPCSGDSGGPAFIDEKVVGVVSYGISRYCDGEERTGFMAINDRLTRRFIKRRIRN
jgi:hypothetical protein